MATRPLRVFFSVGEPSGDLHGANLIRQLRQTCPDAEFVGFGGPRMQDAGMTLLADLTELAIMWIAQAIRNLGRFHSLLQQADALFFTHRPDAVILIDYPGFNWWVARKAKKHGIPVYYYGAPQMWAWASWRIHKMRRLVDRVICKLPFEADWYRQRGVEAVYVGHPYFDQLSAQQLDQPFMQTLASDSPGPLVTILPGSRTQEVRNNLPWFLKAAAEIRRHVPQVRFALASFNEHQAALARDIVGDSQLPITIVPGKTSELIALSHCCLACSGSVSLELMYYNKPAVILYWVPRLSYALGKLMVKVRYMTLVNLLACDDRFDLSRRPHDPTQSGVAPIPYPEYPTCQDRSADLAEHIIHWLTDEAEYTRRCRQLHELRARFGATGATRSAADTILESLARAAIRRAASARHQAA